MATITGALQSPETEYKSTGQQDITVYTSLPAQAGHTVDGDAGGHVARPAAGFLFLGVEGGPHQGVPAVDDVLRRTRPVVETHLL